jgi:outer membrane immunogenic protein
MNRMLFAGALALAATGQAFAADLPPPAPPPPRAPAAYVPIAPPVYNWGGIYIGVNGGYGFGWSNWTNLPSGPGTTASTGSFDTDGGLVGGTLGFNYQADQFVFGVESDIDWQDIRGNTNNALCGATGIGGGTCETDSDWLGTVRGRLGFAADRVLFYGTAGGAFGNVDTGLTNPGSTISQSRFGWTAGGGIEYAFTDNITAKIEYLFVDLGNTACSANCVGAAPVTGSGVGVPVTFYENIVRAGVNFKFNPF